MGAQIDRRSFVKTGAAAAAGFMIVKSGVLAAGKSPNEKLNIAVIGCGKRGTPNAKSVSKENIVALCDCNENNLAKIAKTYPNAKTYIDWRKCLEQKDIEAVLVSTIDHTHAFVNVWAMNRGLHVYSEKPLANSVHEARVVRETYLKNKGKIATQMGVQRHAIPNMARIVELIKDGAIGKPSEVRLWSGRKPVGGDYLPEEPVPAGLHWDLWVGPSPNHPFNSTYIAGGCLKWNRFWDFGSGQIGDMGSHIMDIAWWALDLGQPTSAKCEGSPVSPYTLPTWITAEWEHPANSWRGPVTVYWYDADKRPGVPSKSFTLEKMDNGAIFKGDKGYLVCDFTNRYIMPVKNNDMTQFKPPKPDEVIPDAPNQNHHEEWIKACKTGGPTRTDFDYSGTMIEQNLLALVAYRVGKKLDYDPKTGKATNCPEAGQYLQKTYRDGWVLNG